MKTLKHLKTFESFNYDKEVNNDINSDINSQVVDILQQNGFTSWILKNNIAEDKYGRAVKISKVLSRKAPALLNDYMNGIQEKLPNFGQPGSLMEYLNKVLGEHGYEIVDYIGDVACDIETREECTITELIQKYKPSVLHAFMHSDMRNNSI
jgi:hypothetical protein